MISVDFRSLDIFRESFPPYGKLSCFKNGFPTSIVELLLFFRFLDDLYFIIYRPKTRRDPLPFHQGITLSCIWPRSRSGSSFRFG